MNSPKPPSGPVGYAWIRDQLGAPSFLGSQEARIANVVGMEVMPEGAMLVPVRIAPEPRMLDHALFALKHEGINLHLLSLALRQVPAAEMLAAFTETPNGSYIRKACYLWEQFTGRTLEPLPGTVIRAPYTLMFDPTKYVTGKSRRYPKWRIDFNGLGDLAYCPIVRLTTAIQALLDEDILGQARTFAEETNQAMLDRALSWAYLSETEGSFAIEGETPTQSKAAAFANLLKQAHDPKELTEDYLVNLQNAIITNPLDMAAQFRNEQNRLQRGGRGAVGVTYVPPEPSLAIALMDQLMQQANEPPQNLPPLIQAALTSFGFVFIHPFMDGNGRLSRFLIHHCLGQSGLLPKNFLLPVSVAMKRHESEYLEALTSFSRPARDLCQVTWLAGEEYSYEWHSDAEAAFRYIDFTACVEFTLRMTKAALEHDLRRETQFLIDFDRVYRIIDEVFDIRSTDLSNLIIFAFEQGGVLSKHRRKQYVHRVPEATLNAIETEVQRCLKEKAAEHDIDTPDKIDEASEEQQELWP